MKWDEKSNDCLQDENNIKGFYGEYRFLSNFEECSIEYQGFTYKSSEAAYQAAKTLDLDKRMLFTNMTPTKSKRAGRKLLIREDWEEVKEGVMYDILMDKFTRNEELKAKLLDTKDKYLEETNWWGDKYWGVCNGKGLNRLGEILMTIREHINQNQKS